MPAPQPNTPTDTDRQAYRTYQAGKQRNLGKLLSIARKQYAAMVEDALAERGHPDLRLSHMAILGNLELETGNTVTEMAERLHLTKQAAGKALREMETHGYVCMIQDEGDRRAQRVRYTRRGLDLFADVAACMSAIITNFTAGLAEGEIDQLAALLQRLIDANTQSKPDWRARNLG